MLWEHEFERRVFSQLLRVHPNYHECYYVSIQTVRTCSLFLLGNSATKKRTWKQLVYFDDQNVKSLCMHHHSLRQQLVPILCFH